MWHGYFIVERGSIGSGNWTALRGLFEAMGTQDSSFPCYNNHRRTRLDDDAVLYESLFDPNEVSIQSFKQLLADEFGVPVSSIEHTTDVISYGDYETTVWEFLYNAIVRFTVRRFGQGGTWRESGDECRGYLALYQAAWESENG